MGRGNYTFVAVVSFVALLVVVAKLPETKKKMEKLSVNKVLADYVTLITNKSFLYTSLPPSLGYAGYMSTSSYAANCNAYLIDQYVKWTFGPLIILALFLLLKQTS